MSFTEAVSIHCPYITPKQIRGIDPLTIKATIESKIWRLRNFQGLPPTFDIQEIEQYMQGESC